MEYEYPWQIFVEWPTKYSNPHCGGSVISQQHVLTAAHCVPGWKKRKQVLLYDFIMEHPWYMRVSLGDHNWKDKKFKFVTLSNIVVHPEEWDVAIFTLSKKINFSNKISPICLPAMDDDHAGRLAIITGWGFTKDNFIPNVHPQPPQPPELHVANVTIMSDGECAEQLRQLEDYLRSQEMCSIEFGSTCNGDSGGPMFLEEFNRYCIKSNIILQLVQNITFAFYLTLFPVSLHKV